MGADFKAPPRIVDRDAQPLDRTPLDTGVCPLCGGPMIRYSRAHIVPKGRHAGGDDLPENLAWICGDGVMGCHGLLTHGNRVIGHPIDAATARARLIVYCRATVPLYGAYADTKRYPGWLEDYYGGNRLAAVKRTALEAHDTEVEAA